MNSTRKKKEKKKREELYMLTLYTRIFSWIEMPAWICMMMVFIVMPEICIRFLLVGCFVVGKPGGKRKGKKIKSKYFNARRESI
jgi:hypothetical protein